MQVKIVIGTISFMLTMIILGFAALREPARLEEFSAAAQARSIEEGAHIYKSNCANCHGVDGDLAECYDSGGNAITCVGAPLNTPSLLCTELDGWEGPVRTELLGWETGVESFVQSTIAAGRPGTQMPTWSQQYGGAMRDDQVRNVANFVLNWKDEELCSQPAVVFNWPDAVVDYLVYDADDATIEAGDPVNGEALYTSYACNTCHGDPSGATDTATIGPWLGDIAERGAEIEGYDSAQQYVYRSILDPNEYIAENCPTGACAGPTSGMRQTYSVDMGDNPQDMADILSYLVGE